MNSKIQTQIDNLLSANNRQAIGFIKREIGRTLIDTTNKHNCESIVQEMIKCILIDSRAIDLIQVLEACAEESEGIEKAIQGIFLKNIQQESQQNPEPETIKQSTKQIRMFLGRFVVKRTTFMEKVIKTVKKSQDHCFKLLELLEGYFSEKEPNTNITQLIVLCVNLAQNYQKLTPKTISSCLRLIYIFFSFDQLRDSLETKLMTICETLFNKLICVPQALKIMCIVLKKTQKIDDYSSLVENVLERLIRDILPKNKQYEALRFCYSGTPKAEEEFCKTFNSIGEFLWTVFELFPSLAQQIFFICKDLCLVRVESPVISCLKVFHSVESNMSIKVEIQILLQQLLTSCITYEQKQAGQLQLEILKRVSEWLNNNGMLLAELHAQSALEYFFQQVKLGIEKQFESQFDEGEFRAKCNLLCYLSTLIKPENKDNIIVFIKSLLNLNESCEKKYKEIIVKEVIHLLILYSKVLLPENQFLKEVVEDMVLKNLPSNLPYLQKLANDQLFSSVILPKLQAKLKQRPFLLGKEAKASHAIWNIILTLDKKTAEQWPDDEWYVLRSYLGRKKEGKKWGINRSTLKQKESQYKALPLEYKQQLELLSELQKM